MLLCCSLILYIVISYQFLLFIYGIIIVFFINFLVFLPLLLKYQVFSNEGSTKQGCFQQAQDCNRAIYFFHLLLKVFLNGKQCTYNYWYNTCFFIPVPNKVAFSKHGIAIGIFSFSTCFSKFFLMVNSASIIISTKPAFHCRTYIYYILCYFCSLILSSETGSYDRYIQFETCVFIGFLTHLELVSQYW